MTDPFEVRMRFTSLLHHLNASTTSAQKAANYALKFRDQDEDLHSVIIEQLERNSMNSRANIMYFIEHLCDAAQRENHMEFVRMMQRDILRVVDAVAPPSIAAGETGGGGAGAANVKVVRRVLAGLQTKQVLLPQTVAELEECLKERETAANAADLSPTSHLQHSVAPTDTADTPRGKMMNGVVRLDKRQIEQRIEEDRERHKRLRESIWAVDHNEDGEYERLWEEGSDVGEDDFAMADEDQGERGKAVEFGD